MIIIFFLVLTSYLYGRLTRCNRCHLLSNWKLHHVVRHLKADLTTGHNQLKVGYYDDLTVGYYHLVAGYYQVITAYYNLIAGYYHLVTSHSFTNISLTCISYLSIDFQYVVSVRRTLAFWFGSFYVIYRLLLQCFTFIFDAPLTLSSLSPHMYGLTQTRKYQYNDYIFEFLMKRRFQRIPT